jgi:hypothetical protein
MMVALMVVAACGGKPPVSATAPSTTEPTAMVATATATPPAAPAPATPREITIDSVDGTNPLIVRGRARTFENALSVRVRDARGALLAEEHVMSVGEMGQHNPYSAELWLVRDPGASITVEALEYSAKDGSERSLVTKTVPFRGALLEAALFFPHGDCTRIEPVVRKLPKSVAMARLLVEALLAGPSSGDRAGSATAAFPDGSDVRSVVLRDGVLTVDFNERLQNVGGACAATAVRESVTRTLQKLPSVKRVVLTAGGSEALALQP